MHKVLIITCRPPDQVFPTTEERLVLRSGWVRIGCGPDVLGQGDPFTLKLGPCLRRDRCQPILNATLNVASEMLQYLTIIILHFHYLNDVF
jgi:hypothetical protein